MVEFRVQQALPYAFALRRGGLEARSRVHECPVVQQLKRVFSCLLKLVELDVARGEANKNQPPLLQSARTSTGVNPPPTWC